LSGSEEDLDFRSAWIHRLEAIEIAGLGIRQQYPVRPKLTIDRNLELTPQLEMAQITQPAFFIAGTEDPVLRFGGGRWVALMDKYLADLRGKVFVEGAGHWVQMERPAAVNEALLGFLKTVS